jgi:hypothetical protein
VAESSWYYVGSANGRHYVIPPFRCFYLEFWSNLALFINLRTVATCQQQQLKFGAFIIKHRCYSLTDLGSDAICTFWWELPTTVLPKIALILPDRSRWERALSLEKNTTLECVSAHGKILQSTQLPNCLSEWSAEHQNITTLFLRRTILLIHTICFLFEFCSKQLLLFLFKFGDDDAVQWCHSSDGDVDVLLVTTLMFARRRACFLLQSGLYKCYASGVNIS